MENKCRVIKYLGEEVTEHLPGLLLDKKHVLLTSEEGLTVNEYKISDKGEVEVNIDSNCPVYLHIHNAGNPELIDLNELTEMSAIDFVKRLIQKSKWKDSEVNLLPKVEVGNVVIELAINIRWEVKEVFSNGAVSVMPDRVLYPSEYLVYSKGESK